MRYPAVLVAALLAAPAAPALEDHVVTAVERPPTTPAVTLYVGNRPPLRPSPLVKLPIGAIRPRGWVLTQLQLEAEGFSGRLTELSEFLRKEGNGWLSPNGEGAHGWEEVPYWLKGFGDLGYVLGDERIIREARVWIEGALATQREDGYFGPRMNLTSLNGKPDLWPHMIMLNALQSYHEFSGDRRVLDFMTKYFRWQLAVPEDDFLVPFWQQQRGSDNLASVYWLYNRTGDAWLLELGHRIHRRTAPWTERVANWHGVNIAQAFRGPAVYYQQSGDPRHLQATWDRIADVWGVYGQVPGGGYGSDENCRPGYTGPRQGTETCTWAELMLSYEMLLKIDGDPRWADRCEDVAFNSLPASMTADLKGLRYLTAPNLVVADRRNHAPGIENGGEMLSYNPHGYRCCQHNVAHAWPYYAEHLWLATAGGGLAAALYAPCEVRAQVADGVEVTIVEDTQYPFDETVTFKVTPARPASFALYFRVPGWCRAPRVQVNGQNGMPHRPNAPAGYLVLERTWQPGDTVELRLPMAITLRRWEKNDDSISVDRGPLTFSLEIGEQYARYSGTARPELDAAWPAHEVLPTTPWNYGLAVDPSAPERSFEVVRRPWDGTAQPFTLAAAPVTLKARARKIPGWKLDPLCGLVGNLQPSPAKSDEPEETVTLVPMGCARLRVAALPTLGVGPDAHEWVYREPPARASHYFDNITALSDGRLPSSSNDHSIPRFTWWDHKGTLEWVQYSYERPRKFSQAAVYWFDDTGQGACRVPQSWRLLYQVKAREMAAEGEWQPVELVAGAYECAPDKLHVVQFKPVETTGLRLEVQLQPNFSGGVLEWRVE